MIKSTSMVKHVLSQRAVINGIRLFSAPWSKIKAKPGETIIANPEDEKQQGNLPKRDVLAERILRKGSEVDWDQLRSETNITDKLRFTIQAMGSIINMRYNHKIGDSTAANSLVQYVNDERMMDRYKKNPVFMAHYCALIGQTPGPNTASEIRHILDYLEANFKQSIRYPIFRTCLYTLAESSKENLHRALEVYRSHKEVLSSDFATKALASCCLNYDMIDEALKCYSDVTAEPIDPTQIVAKLAQLKGFTEKKMKWIELMAEKRIVPDMANKTDTLELLRSIGYDRNSSASISWSSRCSSCGDKLKMLNDEELQILTLAAKKDIVIRDDEYVNSTPQEISRFDRFLVDLKHHNFKFDLIVDGLNISNARQVNVYGTSIKSKFHERKVGHYRSTDHLINNLISILKMCLEEYGQILLVGRVHMKKWHRVNVFLDQNKDKISHFYASNDSRDDAFMIQAALQSADCRLLSNDFFRSEKCHLQEHAKLFERWIEYRVVRVDEAFNFIRPSNCEVVVNANENHIHVPFRVNETTVKWVCAENSAAVNQFKQ